MLYAGLAHYLKCWHNLHVQMNRNIVCQIPFCCALCSMVCVTLYIVMSERSATARICGCSLSLSRSVPYARLTRSSLFRILNSRINTIVAGANTNNSNFPLIIKSVRYNMVFPLVFRIWIRSLAWVNHWFTKPFIKNSHLIRSGSIQPFLKESFEWLSDSITNCLPPAGRFYQFLF